MIPNRLVVLIDDDQATQNIFQMVLENSQFSLTAFMSGEEAIYYLSQHDAPDIIVIDLFLPGINGYQVLQKLRQSPLDKNCQFVGTTSYWGLSTSSEMLERGFNGCLLKSLEACQILPYLQQLCS